MKQLTTRLLAKRCYCATGLLLGLCALACPAFAEPRINEFLAANNRGLADGDGEALDWIVIYNPGRNAVPRSEKRPLGQEGKCRGCRAE